MRKLNSIKSFFESIELKVYIIKAVERESFVWGDQLFRMFNREFFSFYIAVVEIFVLRFEIDGKLIKCNKYKNLLILMKWTI